MTVERFEEFVPEARCWIEFGRIGCDYCPRTLPADGRITEFGEVSACMSDDGWTRWVGGLVVCPDCRKRMSA